jgi:uncharacterized protein (DUF1697 family)
MAMVALIRGLNAGGHRTFRPSLLAAELAHLGSVNIGATGTFVFRKNVSRVRLQEEIRGRLPFASDVMICSAQDIAGLVSIDPFRSCPAEPGQIHFVSLLLTAPRKSPHLPMQLPSGAEDWVVQILARHGRFVAGIHKREMRAIRYLGELDTVFGVRATTRSWSTILAIAKALG